MKYIIGLVILLFSIAATSENLAKFDPFGSNWKPEKEEGYVERDLVSVISEISLSVGYHFDEQCYSAISGKVLVQNKNIPAYDHLSDIAFQLPDALILQINMMKVSILLDASESIHQFDCSESLVEGM
jgi:hypothetical protein